MSEKVMDRFMMVILTILTIALCFALGFYIMKNSTIELPGMTVYLGEVTSYSIRNAESSKLTQTDESEKWILLIDTQANGRNQHFQCVIHGHQYMAEIVKKLDDQMKRRTK